jgi:hypothetical protein
LGLPRDIVWMHGGRQSDKNCGYWRNGGFSVHGGSQLCTLFLVLGSVLWKMEKMKLNRDRFEAAPITTW